MYSMVKMRTKLRAFRSVYARSGSRRGRSLRRCQGPFGGVCRRKILGVFEKRRYIVLYVEFCFADIASRSIVGGRI